MGGLRAERDRQPPREGDRHADDVLGDGLRADAARAGDDDAAGEKLGEHQAADANRGALHPLQTRRRWKDVAVDERCERDVGLGQQPPNGVAVPGVEEGVLRKIASQLIDEVPRQDPDRGRADHADQDLHRRRRKVPLLPPLLNISRMSPITMRLSTAFTMS